MTLQCKLKEHFMNSNLAVTRTHNLSNKVFLVLLSRYPTYQEMDVCNSSENFIIYVLIMSMKQLFLGERCESCCKLTTIGYRLWDKWDQFLYAGTVTCRGRVFTVVTDWSQVVTLKFKFKFNHRLHLVKGLINFI